MEPLDRYIDEECNLEEQKETNTRNSNHPNEHPCSYLPPSPRPVPVANNQHSNFQHSYNQRSAAHSSGSSSSSARSTSSNTASATTSRPKSNSSLEFKPAVNYITKVKNRFESQPDIYKQFLRIMHTYQKEQRNRTDRVLSSVNTTTMCEIFAQVAELFENHDDLLQEFLLLLDPDNAPAGLLSPVPVANSQSHSNPQHLYNQSSAVHSSGSSPSSARSTPSNTASATTSQPSANYSVEFNPVNNYLNKVKNRFQGQRGIYMQFMELLHRYQTEQQVLKDGKSVANPLTEDKIHARVAKLFQDHEDLLQEFFQFLPDANALAGLQLPKPMNNDHNFVVKNPTLPVKSSTHTSNRRN